ncbi:hypothetical protein HO133_005597 [Letharia lupina]|uniref:Prion-inhibition and propagation HeLo domain-containing protein n=1 Tax=Letharia lupina TaxID=560253 RepID=A0A8H6C990_9LECA|nr:uncharacterized protein HO133_005597 [Letharia lupina]KAF6219053.1 hypothetical protein HO133_005597 [Letharia lupina]
MATGLEAVGAASTLVSIIGFSFQIFDGCVKGFVLLSTAGNLGRDADIFRSMLDWEQFRLEQWAEKVNLQDPSQADMLMDWKLVADTLQHLENLTNDTRLLKEKYKLVLLEKAPPLMKATAVLDDEKTSTSRFKRLFGQGEKYSSTAAAKVIQAKNSYPKKLWWAAVDKQSMKRLIDDIAHFVQRLHDLLNSSIQSQMKQSVDTLLHDATQRYQNVPDLEFLRELAARMRPTGPDYGQADEDDINAEIDKKFRNLLFHSIRKGDTEEVELLLDKGVDVHADDNVGWPPMVRAAEHGQLAIVEILLERGANPLKGTVGDRLPLHFAAEGGHLAVVRLLLKQPSVDPNLKDYTGQTAIFKAANNGHHAVVELLLQQKDIDPDAVSKDGFTPLLQTIFGRHQKVVRLLLDRADVNPNQCDTTYKQTPLWMASTAGDEILQMFLERKDIEINGQSRWGETPLYQALQRKRLSAAKMLLDAGADPNVPTDEKKTVLSWAAAEGSEESIGLLLKQPSIEVDVADKSGQTPLLRAADAGHTKCVRILLDKGANLKHADNEGRTALALAAIKGHKVVAKLLLKNSAEINAQDRMGNTPLALAAEKNHDAVVRFLLESGADADLPDEDEETPFEKARDRHMNQIVEVFKEILKL